MVACFILLYAYHSGLVQRILAPIGKNLPERSGTAHIHGSSGSRPGTGASASALHICVSRAIPEAPASHWPHLRFSHLPCSQNFAAPPFCQAELCAARQDLTLLKQPLRTLRLFAEVVAHFLAAVAAAVYRRRYSAVLPLAALLAALAAGKRVPGAHTAYIAELELSATYAAWWCGPCEQHRAPCLCSVLGPYAVARFGAFRSGKRPLPLPAA